MNAPVMLNRLFKQIAGLLVAQLNHAILFKTVYIYIYIFIIFIYITVLFKNILLEIFKGLHN